MDKDSSTIRDILSLTASENSLIFLYLLMLRTAGFDVVCRNCYLFGSISPVIKSSLNYNQKQVARLGVAKDLGDSVGFLAGSMSEILPLWALL
ncbi:protein nuclear fusion defective 4, partial [Tanacetum coccineum]